MSPDRRCRPLVELDRHQIEHMLAPLLKGRSVRAATRVDGGLINTVYRVALGRDPWSLALRVGPCRPTAFERERQLLDSLAGILPVPEVLWVDSEGERCGYPYMAYRWIEGETLNAYRRRASPAEWPRVAEPLGRVLGGMSAVSTRNTSLSGRDNRRAPAGRSVASELERARSLLGSGPVRTRLGARTADRLEELFTENETSLCRSDGAPVLVHGDFCGRNILVAANASGAVAITGVIDWDSAGRGARLWDPGSLFRYSRRYGPEFRDEFIRGYHATGGELPGRWWLASRLLDATRLVAILGEDGPLPTVFAECRALVEQLLIDQEGSKAI